jgi:hypothetical protein
MTDTKNVHEVYPVPLDPTEECTYPGGKRAFYSYLHGDAERFYNYDIFHCNQLLLDKIDKMRIGDEAPCVIIAPDGDHVEAIAVCHRRRIWNESTPEVLVCLTTDYESLRHAREKAAYNTVK